MSLAGVVFDFDGVIANSEPLHLRVYQVLLGEEGLSLSAAEYYARYLGIDDEGVFRALARDKGLAVMGGRIAELLARKTAIFQRLSRDGALLFDGAAACVRAVAAAVPVAIASGALRHEMTPILASAGLLDVVPVIVAAGDTPRGKPAPDPYARAVALMAERAGRALDPARVVAIEDSPLGLRAARRAGLRTLGLTTSYPADRLVDAEEVWADLSRVTLEGLEALCARPPAPPAETMAP